MLCSSIKCMIEIVMIRFVMIGFVTNESWAQKGNFACGDLLSVQINQAEISLVIPEILISAMTQRWA